MASDGSGELVISQIDVVMEVNPSILFEGFSLYQNFHF